MAYGGLALSATVFLAGGATSWTGPRTLMLSQDGGLSWDPQLNSSGLPLLFEGLDVSMAHPANGSVAFASNYRTWDGGASWQGMAGCAAVFAWASNATGNVTLLGTDASQATVVMSQDEGASWRVLVVAPASPVVDVAYDAEAHLLYVVAGNRLYQCQRNAEGVMGCGVLTTPVDQYGAVRHKSVAVDPREPTVVYVSSAMDIYASSVPVLRSADRGQTWQNLLVEEPLGTGAVLQGVHEVSWLRVHPQTGALWAAGGCFGVWRWIASGV
jgi:hypothetical protein